MEFPASCTIISDEVSQDLPDVVRFVREFRLPGIELRSMFGRAFKDLTPADLVEVKRVAAGEGWRIFGCSSPVFKCDLDDAATVRSHVGEFRRSLEVARSLGCDLVRVFTFLRRSPEENRAALPRIVEHLGELRAIAEGSGVRIGIENEHSCTVATGAEVQALCAALPDPSFGIVWDPCNVIYVPAATGPATEGFASFVSRVFHIHLKDAKRGGATAGGSTVAAAPLGEGEVGWPAHLQEIQRLGYRGMLSLETHWRVEELSEKELHLPAGYAFSKGGEAASRRCLGALRAWL
jgi:sugar phosphate isomerase/epimerase